jgi:hypothetical protein
MAFAQIRADDVTFGRSVFQQHQHFDRIAKIILIECGEVSRALSTGAAKLAVF